MTRRRPVDLLYIMIDVSAVNAYIVWQKLHGENDRNFSRKRRRKFLIHLGKELARMSSALSMHKKACNSASKQQKKDCCN